MAEAAKRYVTALPDRDTDFSGWYTEVIQRAELADYAPVRGCMVIRPMGYALWENIQAHLDRRLKATGHVNAYFPLLIPESFLAKEAEHVEGFAPQVAWVTQGGDEPLSERLAIRPTSETIICAMYAKWIQSYRDLPVLINQWANVLRWEKRTTLFLRTTEFLWQEGHTAHATEAEAEEETLRILDIYRDLVETDLAIPVVPGRKTESEKFAGALRTYSIEALMGDGRALQAGTSHNLGQHFARVFDITFLDRDGQRKYVWQTSWGVSTRLIGALIMVHGDRDGLILPPRVAPIQAVIVPIWRTEEQRTQVLAVAQAAEQALRDRVRVKADLRDEYTPGWKFAEWELRGVPVRIEIGPRDVEQRQAVLVRRDTRERRAVPLDDLPQRVLALLEELQTALFQRALEFRRANTHYVETLAQFEEILAERRGFLYAHWCGSATCEAQIKDRTGATIRVIPFDRPMDAGRCLWCQAPVEGRVLFARAY
jgi:prolyl-tRNA synthetase